MKKLIKFILYSFIGLTASFVLVLISAGVHLIATCAIAALAAAAFVYYLSEKTGLQKVLAVVSFIVVFFLYMLVYYYTNTESDSDILGVIIFGAPYILFSYALIEGASEK